MKILVKRTAHLPELDEVECHKCKSTLELEEGDLTTSLETYHDFRGEPYRATAYKYTCPVCNTLNTIKEELCSTKTSLNTHQ